MQPRQRSLNLSLMQTDSFTLLHSRFVGETLEQYHKFNRRCLYELVIVKNYSIAYVILLFFFQYIKRYSYFILYNYLGGSAKFINYASK